MTVCAYSDSLPVPSSCSIAGGAASALGVGEDTMLVLAFPDGDIVCET